MTFIQYHDNTPAPGDNPRSEPIRDNFKMLKQAAGLYATEQVVPDLTVRVQPGLYTIDGVNIVSSVGGDSPLLDVTFGGSLGQQRLDLLVIDALEVLSWIYGSWTTPPAVPTFPLIPSSAMSICAILTTYGMSQITFDEIVDTRPLLNLGSLGGVTGPQGEIGESGVDGETGPQGETGPSGSGSVGAQGVTGLRGVTGVGVAGAAGAQGIQGVTGFQGVTGPVGGGTGLKGETGVQGVTGFAGSTGPQGVTGIQGITGLRGITGLGTTGIQGTTGLAGSTGLKGVTGTQGVTGAGAQGVTGLAGPTGSAGLPGVTGPSNFDVPTTDASFNRVSQPFQVISATSSTTINWASGNQVRLAMDNSITTLTLSNPRDGEHYLVKITQDVIGSKVIAWPAGIMWKGGSPPTLTSTGDAKDVVTLVYDGTEYLGDASLDFNDAG